MYTRVICLAVALVAVANAFAPGRMAVASRMSLRMSETPEGAAPEQTVQDLNLEEMFEVFEEADKLPGDKTAAAPAAASSKTFDPKTTVGATSPFGFFDPAGLTLDIDESQYKLYQEAETKHGRVAMLAFLGIFLGEVIPSSSISGPAIYQFQQAGEVFSYWAAATCAVIEGGYILKNWQPLDETMNEPLGLAKLNKDAVPGDYGFDPLNKKPKTEEAYNLIKTKELNNGRLAMIAVAGIVAQELVTGVSVF